MPEGLAFSKNVALVYLDLFQVSSTFQTFIGSSFSSSKPIMDGLLLGNTISLVQMVSHLNTAIMIINIRPLWRAIVVQIALLQVCIQILIQLREFKALRILA